MEMLFSCKAEGAVFDGYISHSDKFGVVEANDQAEAEAKWRAYLEANHKGTYNEWSIDVQPLEVIR